MNQKLISNKESHKQVLEELDKAHREKIKSTKNIYREKIKQKEKDFQEAKKKLYQERKKNRNIIMIKGLLRQKMNTNLPKKELKGNIKMHYKQVMLNWITK